MCVRILLAALLALLTLAAPVRAQEQDLPKELWSEYPLVPRAEQAAPAPIGPFLPPTSLDAPAADDASRWSMWLALLALGGAFIVLFLTRIARPAAAFGTHALDGGAEALRVRARRLHARAGRLVRARPTRRYRPQSSPRPAVRPSQATPLPQHELPSAVAAPESEQHPDNYIAQRSGLLRSRYVVVSHELGRTEELARSRGFWRVGGAARQLRASERAWDDLVDDLRAAGWDLDPNHRGEHYVPLRRALPFTLELYTQSSTDDSDEA